MAKGYTLEELQKMGAKPVGTGLTLQQLQDMQNSSPTSQQPGFFQGMAQGIAKPFLQVAGAVKQGAQGLGGLVKAGTQTITGNKAGAAKTIQETNANFGQKEHFGYFGDVTPGGFDEQGKPLSTYDSTKQALGVGAQIGSYAAGGEGVAKVAGQTVKGAILKGAAQGAKFGAIGGGLNAAGQGLAEPGGGFGDAALNGVIGAGLGAVGGGLLGGAAAGVGKAVRPLVMSSAAKSNEEIQKLAEVVSPKLTAQGKVAAFMKPGKPGGVVNEGGKFFRAPSTSDLKMAEAVHGIVKPGERITKSLTKVNTAINFYGDKMQKELENTPGIFNNSQLKAALQNIEPDLSIQADPVLEKQHNLVVGKFMKIMDSHPNTKLGLWQARQEFDDFLNTQVKGIFNPEKNSAVKSVALKIRQAVNAQIKEGLPADSQFAALLDKEALLYRARFNMAEKAAKVYGTNPIGRFFQKNPAAKKALGIGAAALGAGALGAAGVHIAEGATNP